MPPLPTVIPPVAAWRVAPPAPPLAPNQNIFMYMPDINSAAEAADARAVFRANQFPSDPAACNRVLILADDAIGTGLGYTSRLLMVALMVAVKEKRVLMPVPHRLNRWCARPPFTLNCLYEPWTHCPVPFNASARSVKWNHRCVAHRVPEIAYCLPRIPR